MWHALLADELARHTQDHARTYTMAQVESVLGDQEAALRDLTLLVAQHEALVSGIGIDPHFDPLRANPRFQSLCAQVGLPTR